MAEIETLDDPQAGGEAASASSAGAVPAPGVPAVAPFAYQSGPLAPRSDRAARRRFESVGICL